MAQQQIKLYTQSFQYDFAVDGGALGTVATGAGCINTGIALPKFSCLVVGYLLVQSAISSATDTATLNLCNVNNFIVNIRNLPGAPLAPGGFSVAWPSGPVAPSSGTNTTLLLQIDVEALTSGKFILMFSYYSPIASLT